LINTSNEYKQRIRRNRVFIPKATITLADSTVLQIAADDIMQGGLKIDDRVGDKVSLGSANINKCSLTLKNFSGKFDTYNFSGAVIRPHTGLQLSVTVEYLAKGVFTADRPTVSGSIIVLEALDNMAKFDREFSTVNRSFPCTALQLLQAVCLHCGVFLATVSFTDSGHIIEQRPEDPTISCREIVSWVAQIAGCFARCNNQGSLELKWFDFETFETGTNLDGGAFDSGIPYATGDSADGGNFTNYSSGDNSDGGTFLDTQRYHHLYIFSGEPTISTDDIYITGIQVTDSSENPTTILFGSAGYVLTIADNKLIQNASQAAAIANSVGQKIVGMRFRSFSGNVQSDPAMEAGDVGYVSTRKGNSYPVLLTSLGFSLGDSEAATCGAETPAQSNYRPTQEMKAIIEARRLVKSEKTAREQAIEDLNNRLSHSSGLYGTEVLQPNGSKIYYAHDKPTLAESRTVWKFTAEAIGVSNDGGQTYPYGLTVDGSLIVRILSTVGINADWIRAGSIEGIRIETNTGNIGGFEIQPTGLKSDTMEFFDNGSYPLIWLSKPGFDNRVNGSARANYEPSAVVVRSIDSGIETDITILARDDMTGETGQIIIDKQDLSYGYLKSRTKLTDNGIEWMKYNNGSIDSIVNVSLNGLFLMQGSKSAGLFFSTDAGDLMIQASGNVFINGRKW
jgi:hypothetical protein